MPPPADLGGVAIDACCLLNLAGAGVDAVDVTDALGLALVVVEQVVDEALWIEDVVDGEPVRTAVNLDGAAFTAVGRVTLSADELALYVRLARELDDGEAATLAVARVRGLAVMTDDRKARRVAQEQGLAVLGTAQVLRRLSEHLGTSGQGVAEMLERVQRRSRFRPRRDDPEAEWWQGSLGR